MRTDIKDATYKLYEELDLRAINPIAALHVLGGAKHILWEGNEEHPFDRQKGYEWPAGTERYICWALSSDDDLDPELREATHKLVGEIDETLDLLSGEISLDRYMEVQLAVDETMCLTNYDIQEARHLLVDLMMDYFNNRIKEAA